MTVSAIMMMPAHVENLKEVQRRCADVIDGATAIGAIE
jgi:hypothetical protein